MHNHFPLSSTVITLIASSAMRCLDDIAASENRPVRPDAYLRLVDQLCDTAIAAARTHSSNDLEAARLAAGYEPAFWRAGCRRRLSDIDPDELLSACRAYTGACSALPGWETSIPGQIVSAIRESVSRGHCNSNRARGAA